MVEITLVTRLGMRVVDVPANEKAAFMKTMKAMGFRPRASHVRDRFSRRNRADYVLEGGSERNVYAPKTVYTTRELGQRANHTVEFGGAKIERGVTAPETLSRNADLGEQALRRVIQELGAAGVALEQPEGVPLYRADPDDPKRLIRMLDGSQERGYFSGTRFITER